LAAIFVVSSAAACAAAPAFVSGRVTLRDGPGTNFPAIIVIPQGTEVEVLGCERGWCEVELGDAEGFIRQDLLNFLDAGPPIVVFPPLVYQYGFRYWREHDRGGWNTWRRDRGRPEYRNDRPRGNYNRPSTPNRSGGSVGRPAQSSPGRPPAPDAAPGGPPAAPGGAPPPPPGMGGGPPR